MTHPSDRSAQSSYPPGSSRIDPVDSEDVHELRREVLHLRDLAAGSESRAAVLTDRVAELERELHELGRVNQAQAEELQRNPVVRLARTLGRRVSNPKQ